MKVIHYRFILSDLPMRVGDQFRYASDEGCRPGVLKSCTSAPILEANPALGEYKAEGIVYRQAPPKIS